MKTNGSCFCDKWHQLANPYLKQLDNQQHKNYLQQKINNGSVVNTILELISTLIYQGKYVRRNGILVFLS